MKKLVFMLVAFAAVSFASCGNKTENAGTNDSDSAAQMAEQQSQQLQEQQQSQQEQQRYL